MKKLSGLKIMYSLLGLSIISLASIGFANWVIINTESKSSTITAEIGKIENSNLSATILDTSDFTVRFDSAKGDNTGAITSGTDGMFEKLSFHADFTLNIGSLSSFAGIQIKLGFNSTDGGAKSFIEKLGTPGYIDTTLLSETYAFKLSDTTTSSATLGDYLSYEYQIDMEAKEATIKVTYTFKRGSLFGKENPVYEKGNNPTETLKNFGTAFGKFNETITDDANSKVVLTITPEMVQA